MTHLTIAIAALLASGLTFFTGFGLGTLLMPFFLAFFPVEEAVALTAVVHLLNGLFKALLVGRHAHWPTVFRFGVPAMVAASAGSLLLLELVKLPALLTWRLGAHDLAVTPVKLAVGLLLLAATIMEALPRFKGFTFGSRHLVAGGLISGFFGGLSGHQGALRSAFLLRSGLSKEAFLGTGAVLSCMIDLARLAIYSTAILQPQLESRGSLLATAVIAAFTGASIGRRLLPKITLSSIQRLVTALLLAISLGLMTGII
jgi:uncharacterized membrane protein YfcA